jgi:diacylglycerol O-acyltransferase / wax synthase
MEPLSRQAPLWSVVLITGFADGSAAVVVVLHHVLADGLGGLNVLAALVEFLSLAWDAWLDTSRAP